MYTEGEIQPDGFVSETSTLRNRVNRVSVWNNPPGCLRWEFHPDRLDEAISQLVGQPILVGGPPERPADEVVSFAVSFGQWIEGGQAYRNNRSILLEVGNQMTGPTATGVLHLLHHLCNDTTYHEVFDGSSFYSDDNGPPYAWYMNDGTQFNPAIFTALRQARGERDLELYAGTHRMYHRASNIFRVAIRDVLRIRAGKLHDL